MATYNSSALNPISCLRQGLCPVTSIQQRDKSGVAAAASSLLESHSLYYEIHGKPGTNPDTAKHKIFFVMGLNTTCGAWAPQIRHFCKDGKLEDCVAVVYDNRGVGNSDYPRGPYKCVFCVVMGYCMSKAVFLVRAAWPRMQFVFLNTLAGRGSATYTL